MPVHVQPTQRRPATQHARASAQRALLIAIRPSGTGIEGAQSALRETEALAREIGLEIVLELMHTRASSTLLFGPGKLRELAALTGGPGHARRGPPAEPRTPAEALLAVDCVIVDAVLTPRQQQELARALGVPVIDRAELILRLFALRARTREAAITVELAELRHALPRLGEGQATRVRQGGGGGRGERGHTEVRLQKQRLRLRIAALERELERRLHVVSQQRAQRKGLRSVAIVGYTNAGKSSWLGALSGCDTLVADRPFSTLGTTVRALGRSTADPIVLCDTVGFVRDLPHELIASYASTLAEARDARLLLWVADGTEPNLLAQLAVTERTLEALAVQHVPRLLLLNKVDRIDAGTRAELARAFPDALCVSVREPRDVAAVRARIEEQLAGAPYPPELVSHS
jgi:GTP-binding protein HflX